MMELILQYLFLGLLTIIVNKSYIFEDLLTKTTLLVRNLFTLLFLCVFGIANSQISVTSITPNSGEQCETLSVTVSGTNFGSFTNVSLQLVQASSTTSFYGTVNSSSSSSLFADVTILNSAPTGWYDVIVTNTGGSGVLSNGFEVIPASTPATLILGNNITTLQSTETYAVSQVIGSTFTWFISGSGIIQSGQGTNSILIQWGNNAGTYDVCVVETNVFGCILDTLCLSVNVGSGSNIEDYNLTNKKLVKIIDALGRKVSLTPNRKTILFYIYDDGTVEKKRFTE